jgi:hypothetical protein
MTRSALRPHTEKDRRRWRRTGPIFIAIGALGLISGSTYALWQVNSDPQDLGSVTTGNMELKNVGDIAAWDVTQPRVDSNGSVNTAAGATGLTADKNQGHTIDLSTYQPTPGTTIEVDLGRQIALQGDNLVAGLYLSSDKLGVSEADKGIELSYKVVNPAGDDIIDKTPLTGGTIDGEGQLLGYFQSRIDERGSGLLDKLPNGTTIPVIDLTKLDGDGTADLSIVVYVEFKDVDGSANALPGTARNEVALGNFKTTLKQVLTDGEGSNL